MRDINCLHNLLPSYFLNSKVKRNSLFLTSSFFLLPSSLFSVSAAALPNADRVLVLDCKFLYPHIRSKSCGLDGVLPKTAILFQLQLPSIGLDLLRTLPSIAIPLGGGCDSHLVQLYKELTPLLPDLYSEPYCIGTELHLLHYRLARLRLQLVLESDCFHLLSSNSNLLVVRIPLLKELRTVVAILLTMPVRAAFESLSLLLKSSLFLRTLGLKGKWLLSLFFFCFPLLLGHYFLPVFPQRFSPQKKSLNCLED